jgi:hypothetical protein
MDGDVAPITGCVRADAEARSLLSAMRRTIEAGPSSSGRDLTPCEGKSRMAEHLQNSFRGQQALVNENAALTVRLEQLEAELAESRRQSRGGRDLEVQNKALQAEKERIEGYWKERLEEGQARVAELEAEEEGTKLAAEALELQLVERGELIKSLENGLREKEDKIQWCTARIKVLEQQQQQQAAQPRSPHQPTPTFQQARAEAGVPAINSAPKLASLSQSPHKEHAAALPKSPHKLALARPTKARGDEQQYVDHGISQEVLVELETLKEQLKIANMRAEAMKSRAESKEILAAEAVKQAEAAMEENRRIVRSLTSVNDGTEKLRALEEEKAQLTSRVAQLGADREALEADRDARTALVTALQERLATETRELTSCRLALESAERQCESATRELSVRVRKDAGTDERYESMKNEVANLRQQLAEARHEAAESHGRLAVLERRSTKLSSEAQASSRRADESFAALTDLLDKFQASQRERKEMLESLRVYEESAREREDSVGKQLSLSREQVDSAMERALRAEEKAMRLQVEVDTLQGMRRAVEDDSADMTEKLAHARVELERAAGRRQLTECFAHEEVAARQRESVESRLRDVQYRRRLHECEMALAKAEEEADSGRGSAAQVRELSILLRAQHEMRGALEVQVMEMNKELESTKGLRGMMERAAEVEKYLGHELLVVRQDAVMCRGEAADLRKRFGEAQSALQVARTRSRSQEDRIEALLEGVIFPSKFRSASVSTSTRHSTSPDALSRESLCVCVCVCVCVRACVRVRACV